MKKFIDWLKFGAGIFLCLLIGGVSTYFVIKARQATNPNIVENSPVGGLYVNNNETLTANKRNALVNKKGLKDLTIISCSQQRSPAWTSWSRKTATWTTTLCWGELPSNYSKCFFASNGKEWWAWAHSCTISWWKTRPANTTESVSLNCNYLCRNE